MAKSDMTVCHRCGKNLATCDTAWAAEGYLYCSEYCGVSNYRAAAHIGDTDYARDVFFSVAEEVNPKDIGLE